MVVEYTVLLLLLYSIHNVCQQFPHRSDGAAKLREHVCDGDDVLNCIPGHIAAE